VNPKIRTTRFRRSRRAKDAGRSGHPARDGGRCHGIAEHPRSSAPGLGVWWYRVNLGCCDRDFSKPFQSENPTMACIPDDDPPAPGMSVTCKSRMKGMR
jgi:hypothetical protein